MNNEITVSNSKPDFSVEDNNQRSFDERQEELDALTAQEENVQKRKKNSPYKNFLQVNKDTYQEEDKLMKKNPLAYRIWRFLTNNMDNYNAVMVSYNVLMEVFEVSRTTVYRAIKILEDDKYIKTFKSGTSNIYTINDSMVWSSWGSNLKYSKFQANIIVGETEQSKEEQKEIKLKAEKNKQINIDKE